MKNSRIFICDPDKNTECRKTACQKECYFTTNDIFKKENIMQLPIQSTDKLDYVQALIDEDDPVYNQYEDLLADMGRALEKIRDELQYIENRTMDVEASKDIKECIDGVCQLILLTE